MKHAFFPLFLAGAILFLVVAVPVTADSISSVSPPVGYATGKTIAVTITGVNFTTTEGDVLLMMSGEDNITASVSSWTADAIECSIKITSSKETGSWDVVVIKGVDDSEIIDSGGFTITDPISLSSISPVTARSDDGDVDFTLSGSGLSDIEEVFLYDDNYENITADDVDIDSSSKVTGTFDLTDAEDNTYDVCVEDSFGTVECDLSFAISTDEVGSIDLTSSPAGATIYVDSAESGVTPETIDDLVEGSHKIVLKKSGYEEWGKIVTVEADETTEVDATLIAITAVPTNPPATLAPQATAATPAPARTTIKSTIRIPTTWADTTTAETTAASPLDPAIVFGAAGIASSLVLLRRR